jgi:hypothetical protein
MVSCATPLVQVFEELTSLGPLNPEKCKLWNTPPSAKTFPVRFVSTERFGVERAHAPRGSMAPELTPTALPTYPPSRLCHHLATHFSPRRALFSSPIHGKRVVFQPKRI